MGPRAATALVVVLDQFSRHVYRNAGTREQIEANDRLALSVTEDMLGRGWERALPVPYQVRRPSSSMNMEPHVPCLRARERTAKGRFVSGCFAVREEWLALSMFTTGCR